MKINKKMAQLDANPLVKNIFKEDNKYRTLDKDKVMNADKSTNPKYAFIKSKVEDASPQNAGYVVAKNEKTGADEVRVPVHYYSAHCIVRQTSNPFTVERTDAAGNKTATDMVKLEIQVNQGKSPLGRIDLNPYLDTRKEQETDAAGNKVDKHVVNPTTGEVTDKIAYNHDTWVTKEVYDKFFAPNMVSITNDIPTAGGGTIKASTPVLGDTKMAAMKIPFTLDDLNGFQILVKNFEGQFQKSLPDKDYTPEAVTNIATAHFAQMGKGISYAAQKNAEQAKTAEAINDLVQTGAEINAVKDMAQAAPAQPAVEDDFMDIPETELPEPYP